jgi:hypothetical protein
MSPGPSIALKLLAGITSLALSVRGWHSPEMAVLGGALLLRAGFDLERRRSTNGPPIPRRRAPGPPPAGPAPPGGRAAWSEGADRVAAWARRDRGADPAQVHLDRDWLAAQGRRQATPGDVQVLAVHPSKIEGAPAGRSPCPAGSLPLTIPAPPAPRCHDASVGQAHLSDASTT